jgi:hypothetical protein
VSAGAEQLAEMIITLQSENTALSEENERLATNLGLLSSENKRLGRELYEIDQEIARLEEIL